MIDYMYLCDGTVQYSVTEWDLNHWYHRCLLMNIYTQIGTWSNGCVNDCYQIGII